MDNIEEVENLDEESNEELEAEILESLPEDPEEIQFDDTTLENAETLEEIKALLIELQYFIEKQNEINQERITTDNERFEYIKDTTETEITVLREVAHNTKNEEIVLNENEIELQEVSLYADISIMVIMFLLVIMMMYKIFEKAVSSLTRHF